MGQTTENMTVEEVLNEPGAPVVMFDQVELAFDDKVVLRNISFTLISGHTKIILGASGSGKSTILKIITGLFRAGGTGPNGPHGSVNSHILELNYQFSQAAIPGGPVTNTFPNPDTSVAGPFAMCAKCHPAIAATYRKTGMGRSFRKVRSEQDLGAAATAKPLTVRYFL